MPNFKNRPKWLRLPTPMELGKAKHNALPMEVFGSQPGDYTWEQWEREMRAKYPVRYFVFEELPMKFSIRVSKPISDFIYKIKCHTLKKYKFHLIDIRNDDYKYGYIDFDYRIMLACFKLLNDFVKEYRLEERIKDAEEAISNKEYLYCSEELDKKYLNVLNEIKCLYNWWNHDRKILEKQVEDELTRVSDDNIPLRKRDYSTYRDLEQKFKDQETEMLKRLMDVRPYLWT